MIRCRFKIFTVAALAHDDSVARHGLTLCIVADAEQQLPQKDTRPVLPHRHVEAIGSILRGKVALDPALDTKDALDTTRPKAPGVLTPKKALTPASHAARMLHGSYKHWSSKPVVLLLMPHARMRPVKPGVYVAFVLRPTVKTGVFSGKLLTYGWTTPSGKLRAAAGGF